MKKALRTASIYALLATAGFVLANTVLVDHFMGRPQDALGLQEALFAGVFSFLVSFGLFFTVFTGLAWFEQRAKK